MREPAYSPPSDYLMDVLAYTAGIRTLLVCRPMDPRAVELELQRIERAVAHVLGAIAGGGVLSLGSLIGFVTVLGIAARNGIMLVSHYRHLEEAEGEAFGPALVLRGAEERLSPILMTALSAALALLPLAVSGNVPGHEIEYPMALVILGGLATSTVLNLFFLPAIYGAFGRRRARTV